MSHAATAAAVPVAFRLAFDAAFHDLDRAAGSHNFVSMVALRKKLREYPRETFDAGLLEMRLAGRYSMIGHPGGPTAEEMEAGIDDGGGILLSHVSHGPGKPRRMMAEKTPQPEAPADFAKRFEQEFHACDERGDGRGVVPLALLRLEMAEATPEAFDRGVLALVATGEYSLVDVHGRVPGKVLEAGAVHLDGKAWLWVSMAPAWR